MRYLGSYEISQDLGKGVYKLRNSTTGILLKKTQNISRLKLYRKKNVPFKLANISAFQNEIVKSGNEPCRKEPKESPVDCILDNISHRTTWIYPAHYTYGHDCVICVASTQQKNSQFIHKFVQTLS